MTETLSPEEIEKAGQEFIADLLGSWREENPETVKLSLESAAEEQPMTKDESSAIAKLAKAVMRLAKSVVGRKEPDIVVNVPQQAAPTVKVEPKITVPAPIVKNVVNVPDPKPVRRKIVRDQYGRPEEMIETQE